GGKVQKGKCRRQWGLQGKEGGKESIKQRGLDYDDNDNGATSSPKAHLHISFFVIFFNVPGPFSVTNCQSSAC
ncbi:hypothetical protein PanWU01x14_060070, partial [Parasponia andersonii]